MKYQLSTTHRKSNTDLILENIETAKTAHIFGYGVGVTFSAEMYGWHHTATYETLLLLQYSEPTVVTQ